MVQAGNPGSGAGQISPDGLLQQQQQQLQQQQQQQQMIRLVQQPQIQGLQGVQMQGFQMAGIQGAMAPAQQQIITLPGIYVTSFSTILY